MIINIVSLLSEDHQCRRYIVLSGGQKKKGSFLQQKQIKIIDFVRTCIVFDFVRPQSRSSFWFHRIGITRKKLATRKWFYISNATDKCQVNICIQNRNLIHHMTGLSYLRSKNPGNVNAMKSRGFLSIYLLHAENFSRKYKYLLTEEILQYNTV